MPWFQDDLRIVRPEFEADSACRSPIHFTDVSASSRAVFSVRGRRSTDCSGSKGGPSTMWADPMSGQ